MADETYLSEARLVPLLQQLVRMPSEQSDLQEKDPAILRFIREGVAPLFEAVGARCRTDAMGNLVVEAGPKSEDSLLFAAYAMTHPRAGMSDPFAATVVETKKGPAVRGRGVAEQKSALAAMFAAFAEAQRNGGLKRRFTFLMLTAGETGRHDAIASIMPLVECKPRFAVVGMGTDNRIALANKGRIDIDITVRGKACHSGAPWMGINALTGAQHLMADLEKLKLGVADHPHLGAATLTPTAIDSAPKATHTVPDAVRVTYDRRLLPGENPEVAFAAIRDAAKLPSPWTVETKLGPVMYPNSVAPDGPFMAKLNEAFAAANGGKPESFYCSISLDAGFLGRAGVDTVMLGPGEVDQFHSSEETVQISDLRLMANVYYRLIQNCVGAA